MYGARWSQTYGPDPNPVWLDAIDELTDDECRDGFRRLRGSGDGWPPSLPAFLTACRPRSPGVRYLGVPLTEEQRRTLMLPKPKVAREKIDRVLANCRRYLGVGP